METAGPPNFYIGPDAVNREHLVETSGNSVCEWKVAATYRALVSDPDTSIAWTYPRPHASLDMIKDFITFYPGRIACFVDG